jgi:hypothetical protein
LLLPVLRPLTQAFRGYVEQRNNENPEHECSKHAAENRRANRMTRGGSGALGDDQGQQTKDGCGARHHDRTKSQVRGYGGTGLDILNELPLLHRERDDEDAVLCRSDQDNESGSWLTIVASFPDDGSTRLPTVKFASPIRPSIGDRISV